MNVRAVNQALLSGEIDQSGVFPHLDSLLLSPTVFAFDFGLAEIPREPGMIFIRGARQYGKSTWLEQQLRATIEDHGPGSALYLNSRAGRNRASLVGVLQVLIRHGTTPCGQAKIAREAGLANNTVAAGYLELLMDLMCLGSAYAWDKEKRIALRRKPAKHPFVNLLAALAWHPDRPLSVQGFERLAPQTQAPWYEWLVAQELWRRAAIRGDEFPEVLSFWQSDSHEIDFVDGDRLIEVKRGAASPMGFTWFPKAFPGRFITVVNARRFETSFCRGVTLRDFLVEGA